MALNNILTDIVEHTGDLGFIDSVKVTGSSLETLIEAIDEGKTVIVNGVLNSPEKELEGTFGIKYLGLIKGLVNHPKFKSDDAEIILLDQSNKPKKSGDDPAGIMFRNEKSNIEASVRFSNLGNELNIPKFKGANWNVSFTLDDSSYEEFKSLNSLFSSFEEDFIPELKPNGELYFHIGDPNTGDNKASFLFHKTSEKVTPIPVGLYFPSARVLTILGLKNKVSNNEAIEMSFSDKGALQITLKSENATWKYILPAKRK